MHKLFRLCSVDVATVRRKFAIMYKPFKAMQRFLQFMCEYLSLNVQDLWFSQVESLLMILLQGPEDFKERFVVHTLENINLFLSQSIDENGSAKSQIHELDELCKRNIILPFYYYGTIQFLDDCFVAGPVRCPPSCWAFIPQEWV